MRRAILALAVFVLGATPTKIVELPKELRNYPTWQKITPDRYSVPANLATLCVAPSTNEQVEKFGPHSFTFVHVFANNSALKSLPSKDPFPAGSIIVKEKRSVGENEIHQGVMVKSSKGWEFSYFPSKEGSTFEKCATCHSQAEHDSVFAPYIKK